MKSVIRSLVVGLVVTSCGAEVRAAELSGRQNLTDSRAVQGFDYLSSVAGEFEDVVLQLGSTREGAPFTRTGILLKFDLNCMSELAPLSYRVEKKGDKIKVYVSALEKKTKRSLVAFCQEGNGVREMIMVDGRYDREDVKVVFMDGARAVLHSKTTYITPVGQDALEYGELNGNLYVSVGTSGCLDGASLAHKVLKNRKGDLQVVLSPAVIGHEDSARVRCFVQNRVSFEVELPKNRKAGSKLTVVSTDSINQ